jgi:hypothetical protein
MEKITYTSFFWTNEVGQPRQFTIPAEALSTYVKRDLALTECMKLGGIHAVPTPAYMKNRKVHMTASRKIQRKGWFCQSVN